MNIKAVPPSAAYQIVASNEARDQEKKEGLKKNFSREKKKAPPPSGQNSDASLDDSSSTGCVPSQIVDSNKWLELVSTTSRVVQKGQPFKNQKSSKIASFSSKKVNRSL